MKTLVIILLALLMAKTQAPGTYEIGAVVLAVDYPADIVSVIDGDGEIWCFYGCDDWQAWDRCQLIMSDNGTPGNMYDDMIVSVTYTGYLSLDEILEVMRK